MEATRRGRVGQALRVGKCLRPTFCFGDPQRGAAGEHSRRGNGDPVLTIGMPGGNWRFLVAWRGVGGMMEELFSGRCARGEVAVFERCTCGEGGARRGKSTVHGRTGGGNAIMARATMAGHVLLVYRSNPLSTTNPISIRPLPNWPRSELFQPQALQQTAVCAVEPRAFTRVRPCLPCNTPPSASAHHDDVVCVGVHMTIFQTGTCMQRARHTYRSYACCDSLMRIFHETHPAHPDSVPTPKQTR
jgi:hypothetical protein